MCSVSADLTQNLLLCIASLLDKENRFIYWKVHRQKDEQGCFFVRKVMRKYRLNEKGLAYNACFLLVFVCQKDILY